MARQFFQETTVLSVQTRPHSFEMITSELDQWLREIGAYFGQLTLLMKHTSASLTIQENADPRVRVDLLTVLDKLAPVDDAYLHNDEGPDDMPAHIKSMLTNTSMTLPVIEGRMDLGIWQGVYVIEHRAQNHNRSIRLLFQGERQ